MMRDPAHGRVREIEIRLLVLHEAAVEGPRPLMTSVGADDGEAARESGPIACGRCTERRLHRPVQPTTALKQEPAVPLLRQRERESDAVGRAGRGATIDDAIDPAIGRKITDHRRRTSRPSWQRRSSCQPLGFADGQHHTRDLKLTQGVTGRRRRARRLRRDRCCAEQRHAAEERHAAEDGYDSHFEISAETNRHHGNASALG
jgi:hypothetical protein